MRIETLRDQRSKAWRGVELAMQRNRIAKQGHDYFAQLSAQNNLDSAFTIYRDLDKKVKKLQRDYWVTGFHYSD